QLAGRNMEQRRVGENSLEALAGKLERQEILFPYGAAAVGAGHRGARRGTFQADVCVAKIGERLEITAGPAAQVEDREGRRAFDGLQKCGDVLPHVMIAGAFPE